MGKKSEKSAELIWKLCKLDRLYCLLKYGETVCKKSEKSEKSAELIWKLCKLDRLYCLLKYGETVCKKSEKSEKSAELIWKLCKLDCKKNYSNEAICFEDNI